MDPLIESYILGRFHADYADEIKRSFVLWAEYDTEYTTNYFIDILMTQDQRNDDDTADQFMSLLNSYLDRIIKAHSLVLSDETTLMQKNEILEAILMIQDLGDVDEIGAILESQLEPRELLCNIIAELTTLEDHEAFSIIEDFDPILLDRMRDFISIAKMKSQAVTVEDKKRLYWLRALSYFYPDERMIGLILYASHVLPNQPLTSYITLSGDYFQYKDKNPSVNQVALDVISIIVLTEEGPMNILATYNKHAAKLFDDLRTISRIESEIIAIMNQLQTYKDIA